MNFISSLEKKGVNFQSLDLPNSLNGSMKNFFTALLSLIAEYEHTRRAERQREGIEKIKMDPELRKLKYKGRKSYVSIIAKILPDYLDKKFSIKEICLLIGSRLHREHG